MFRISWSRLVVVPALLFALGPWASSARAQIVETRDSSANPMVEVFKSTIYGGLAGLTLGGALALAMEDDDNADTVRWAFVGGTFLGFGYGIYHVSTRPQPRAMLEHGERGWVAALPEVTVELARSGRGPAGRLERSAATARVAVASIGF